MRDAAFSRALPLRSLLAHTERTSHPFAQAPTSDRPGGDREDDAQIVMAVRQQLVRKRARLRSRLEQLAAEALVVTSDGVLRVTTELAGTYGHLHYDNRTSLMELLSAMNVAGASSLRVRTACVTAA